MLELCKTRTTKSSPDMFNFYAVFAGLDMISDAGGATKCRCKFKASSFFVKKIFLMKKKKFQPFLLIRLL